MARKKHSKHTRIRFIKRYDEYVPRENYISIPRRCRGIYALLTKKGDSFDVVYIGMSTKRIRSRIRSHIRSRRKGDIWTHFSIFEVFDNIYDEEIKELEGLFRVIYRKDNRANELNKQRKFKAFKSKKLKLRGWKV